MRTEHSVLVVDDDPAVARATADILRHEGFAVAEAHSGDEALHCVTTAPPDVVLLDVVLGGESGIALCPRLKDAAAELRPAVILISARRVSPEDYGAGLDVGADDYVGRPISNRELIARVAAAARAARSDAALRASERRFRAIFNDARVGMAVIDESGRLLESNRALQEMTHQAGTALQALRIDEIVRADGRQNGGDSIIEGALLRRDAPEGWARWTTCRLDASAGDPMQAVVIVEDVSERKALQAELAQAQKMEAIGRLAAGIAHEFNNLLMGIKGCAEIASESLPEEGVGAERIRDIIKAAEKGAGVTRQLLDFGRRRDKDQGGVILDRVVEESLAILRPMLGEDVTVKASLDAPGLSIEADSGQIQQVLFNLAINARDAMPSGGTLSIRTARRSSVTTNDPSAPATAEDRVVLEVEDTGCGIRAEHRDKVVEPFFTTKPEGEGTGLGLTTVFAIARQCRGQVTIDSEPGRGTRVTLSFPVVAATSPRAGLERPATPLSGPPPTILVVEDEPLVRMSVRYFLQKAGYRVLDAPDPQRALEILSTEDLPFDVLLSDMVLPGGMDGRQLADQVHETCPEVRTIYMSAYPEHVLKGQGRLRPGDVALQKPFERETLLESIEHALRA